MTVIDIIQALGGRQAIADITGASPNAVSQWRLNGIPPRYWHRLSSTAAAKSNDITPAILEASHPRFANSDAA